MTAALEHYTATLAAVLLQSDQARSMLDSDDARGLLLWHALEEYEHKAVAFDVFQAVSGDDRIRTGVMNAVTAAFIAAVVGVTALSLLTDRASRDPRRLVRSLGELRRSPFITAQVRHTIRDYNRRDFHPDDHHDPDLLEHWRAELFGQAGTLVEQLERTA